MKYHNGLALIFLPELKSYEDYFTMQNLTKMNYCDNIFVTCEFCESYCQLHHSHLLQDAYQIAQSSLCPFVFRNVQKNFAMRNALASPG